MTFSTKFFDVYAKYKSVALWIKTVLFTLIIENKTYKIVITKISVPVLKNTGLIFPGFKKPLFKKNQIFS